MIFMQDIEYVNGPWKKVFFGNYDDYDLSISFNDSGYILSEILNKEKTKAVLNISLIIGVFGDAEPFVETLPRNSFYLINHNAKSNNKYLILNGNQEVVNYLQKDLTDYINSQINQLQRASKSIISIASSYEINLKDYSELPSDFKNAIFSSPLNLFSFVYNSNTIKKVEYSKEKSVVSEDLFLGNYKSTNEKLSEPLDVFKKTFLFGDYKKAMRVFLEEFSHNKINVIVFSNDSSLNNIKYPNESQSSTSMGFPLIKYSQDKIFVNIADLPDNAFSELISLEAPNISEIISNTISEKKSNTLDNLMKDISGLSNEKYTSYDINLAIRSLEIVKQESPGIFLGDFSVSDFYKSFGKNLGYINTISLPENKFCAKAIIYNVVKKISLLKETPLLIVFDDFSNYFDRNDNSIIAKDFYSVFNNDNNNYYLFASKSEVDFSPNLYSNYSSKVSTLDNNELVINLKNGSPVRFVLRDTFSKM